MKNKKIYIFLITLFLFGSILFTSAQALITQSNCSVVKVGSPSSSYPDCAIPTGSPTNGSSPVNPNKVSAFLNKACSYVTSVREHGCTNTNDPSNCRNGTETIYNSDRVKGWTDCYGFVATSVIKSGNSANGSTSKSANVNLYGLLAKYAYRYYAKYPDKYYVFDVRSTKDLLPGDMVFNVLYGSHATIYIGPKGSGFCGCTSNLVDAALPTYPPQCGRNYYSRLTKAVRILE